jgi:hypothetical protein
MELVRRGIAKAVVCFVYVLWFEKRVYIQIYTEATE